MALSGEDKADVSRAFGKKAAGAVSHATSDAKNKAIHAKSGVKFWSEESPKTRFKKERSMARHYEKATGKSVPISETAKNYSH